MADPKPVVLSFSEVIRHNIRRLRQERGWSQRRLAEIAQDRTGDPAPDESWTQFRVSDLEGGRKGRRKNPTPEELAGLARALGVPILDLMLPPDHIAVPDPASDEPPVVPLRIKLGNDVLPPDLFRLFVFGKALPDAVFERLEIELSELVRQGKFAGWATENRLVDAARREGFSEWLALTVGSPEFQRWLAGPDSEELTEEQMAEGVAIPKTESGEEITGPTRFFLRVGSGSKRKEEEE